MTKHVLNRPTAPMSLSSSKAATVVTQRDIARMAGVSQSVVSRVLGGGGYVSKDARTKVLGASARAGYLPDAGARTLVTGTSNIIAMVVANVTNAFYPYAFDRLTSAIHALGHEIMLFNAAGGQDIDSLLPTVLTYKIRAAILMTAGLTSSMAAVLRTRGIQVVMFNRYSLDLASSSVACDNEAGGRLVAETFLKSGLTRLAYFGGGSTSSTNRDRKSGFVGRLAEAGIAPVLSIDGSFSHEWGYEAGALLKHMPDIEAIFCADDDIAMGAIDRLRFDLSRRVPEDVAVIGFDDVPGAAWPSYALTTVRQPVNQMIAQTVGILDQPASVAPCHIRLPGRLIRRKTF